MANAANNSTTEKVVHVAHLQHLEHSAFVFVLFHCVNVHGKAFRTDFDDPIVTLLGIKVIQHGKFLQSLVPPIHHIVLLVNVFARHLAVLALVVERVGADDDGHLLVVDGSVGGVLQMLVSDAAVLVLDFVVPFKISFAHRQMHKLGLNHDIKIGHHKLEVRHGNVDGLIIGLVQPDFVEDIIRFNRKGKCDLFAQHRRSG